ncbi:hypothetical protein V6N11_071052 [Hibiscus sabdariffa]|uniref:SPX domain-containing protein n=1 Tax=Hibiscus sabdariffa TaxID=183260 RepID=A0ABR1ZN20_9ROSI
MKKKVKQYAHQIEVGTIDRPKVLKNFSRMLDNQIEKIVLFLLEQQGLLASKLTKLGEQQDALEERPQISKITELREVYRGVGHDLLKLLFFVEMNAIGLRKILKKFDKRFRYRFTDYYVKTRANHPYSQLQQVFKHVGLGAVVGAVSRNLHELQDRQGSYLSIYDSPSLPLQINSLNKFPKLYAQHALIMQEELPAPIEQRIDEEKYHFMSLLLNLANTFLYMVNTYIIVPTADNYSMSLGAAATVCGIVIGAMAVAQVFSSVYFSAWSNRSYFRPLVFSSIVLFMGNALYALAYDLNSLTVLLLGRLFCGFGSARAVNRRMGYGCCLARISDMVVLSSGLIEKAEKSKLEKDIKQPLLITSEEKKEDDEDPEADESEEAPDEFRQPATSMVSAYRLLTPSVKVQLLIYFMLKYAMEILLSESSVVTTYYFNWSTSTVAIFLACLGLTVLPINIVVGSYISNMFEDRQILLASEIVVCIGILLSFNIIIPYSVPQYVCSGLIMFVSAEVLEGVNLSLLSRVMSSRLSRGTYNGGLLSTEAGTIARVIADATITVAGFFGQSQLLNITLLPSLVICVTSIVATCCTYNSLY